MSYGMHDYLAEKAMQRQNAMRKYANSYEEAEKTKEDRAGSGFHSSRNPKVTGGNRPLGLSSTNHSSGRTWLERILGPGKPGFNATASFNRGLNVDLNKEDEKRDKRRREEEKRKEEKRKEAHSRAVGTNEPGSPVITPSLRDRILQQVMANKYAIGGALGAGGAGATIGALSSNESRLRNALLGGGIGAILGGVSGHIADRYIG